MSPSPAPDSNNASSPASSWMMWTMSSTVIMPTSRPEGSTTAAEINAYFWNLSATSSWSRSTGISVCLWIMISVTRVDRGLRRIDDKFAGADRVVDRRDHEHFPEIGRRARRKSADNRSPGRPSNARAPRSGRAASGARRSPRHRSALPRPRRGRRAPSREAPRAGHASSRSSMIATASSVSSCAARSATCCGSISSIMSSRTCSFISA